jgi:hypothetical protein
MKAFLAVYIGSESSPSAAKWSTLSESARKKREKKGVLAWQKWAAKHGNAILDIGAPLGRTKLVNADGISRIRNQLTAFTVVRAKSHEAAARMFIDHPHFRIFPGDSVEVIECLPMPKM